MSYFLNQKSGPGLTTIHIYYEDDRTEFWKLRLVKNNVGHMKRRLHKIYTMVIDLWKTPCL